MVETHSAEHPLLPPEDPRDDCIIINEDDADEKEPQGKECIRILHLAVPVAANGVLSYASKLITVSQVGRLSSLSLSRLALGQTLYNITGLSIVMGISSGITTFVGQAHGASQAAVKGIILQRGLMVALLTALLPLLGWTWAEGLLQLLGQQQDLAVGAAAYIHWACPALLMSAIHVCMENYLSSQQVVKPLVLVTFTATCLTPFLNHLFMKTFAWGYLGAAVTYTVVQVVDCLMLVAIVIWHNIQQPPGLRPWLGFSKRSLSSWLAYLAVAVPACAMMCLDWWAYEALTLLAGITPHPELAVAATGVCFGIHVIVFLLINGISIAVSIRVANELGAGHPAAARNAVATGVCMGFLTTLVIILPMWRAPHAVAAVFTNDEQVIQIVASCLPALLLSLLGDAISSVLSGSIRGAGRQTLGSVVNFGAFWCFGLPLAALLSVRWGFGAAGLWWAMAVTSAVQAVVYVCVMGCMNWQAEVLRSERLLRSQSDHHDS